MSPILLLAIFVSVTILLVGLVFLASGPGGGKDAARVQMRLDSITGEAPHPLDKPGAASLLREEFVQGSPYLTLLLRGFPRLRDLGLWLEQAGMTMSPRRFTQVAAIVTVFGGILGLLFSGTALGLFVGILVGVMLPFLFLRFKTRHRQKGFEKQFPETLRMLATSLKAGHALPAGIQMLGEELPPPVGLEFAKVSQESGLGLSIDDALKNMLRRMDNPDLRFFVTSVMIQRETGGNLATILHQLDALIRERFKIRGQVKAMTAPGRMTGMVLGVMPLGVGGFIAFLNPVYMAPMWNTPLGRTLAVGGFVLQLMGYLVIRRIVNVRY